MLCLSIWVHAFASFVLYRAGEDWACIDFTAIVKLVFVDMDNGPDMGGLFTHRGDTLFIAVYQNQWGTAKCPETDQLCDLVNQKLLFFVVRM